MKKTLLFLSILFTFPTYSLAQESAIDEMFRVMSMDKQMAGGFEAMLPMIDQMATQLSLDNQGKEGLKEIFRSWYKEDIDREKLLNEFKGLYTDTFDDDEIREITNFYKTPVGRKFLDKSPELMQIGAQLGMQEGQLRQAQLLERLKPFIEEHGNKE